MDELTADDLILLPDDVLPRTPGRTETDRFSVPLFPSDDWAAAMRLLAEWEEEYLARAGLMPGVSDTQVGPANEEQRRPRRRARRGS
jgi:hypothetical protein